MLNTPRIDRRHPPTLYRYEHEPIRRAVCWRGGAIPLFAVTANSRNPRSKCSSMCSGINFARAGSWPRISSSSREKRTILGPGSDKKAKNVYRRVRICLSRSTRSFEPKIINPWLHLAFSIKKNPSIRAATEELGTVTLRCCTGGPRIDGTVGGYACCAYPNNLIDLVATAI